jgi:CheY-like chemotaxis protein
VHVIDDNEVSRRVTSKLISSCGAACDCSSNGFEAAVFMLEALCDTVFLLVPDVSARIGLRHHIARQLRLLHDRLHASGAFEDFKATVPLRTPRWDLLFSDESAVQFFPEHNRDGPAHEILSCMYGAHVHLVDQTMPVMLGGELAEFIRQFEKDFLPKLQAHLPHIANVSDYCARLIRFSAEPLAEDALFTAAVTKPVKKHALMDALQLHRYPSSVGRGDSGSNLTIRK